MRRQTAHSTQSLYRFALFSVGLFSPKRIIHGSYQWTRSSLVTALMALVVVLVLLLCGSGGPGGVSCGGSDGPGGPRRTILVVLMAVLVLVLAM